MSQFNNIVHIVSTLDKVNFGIWNAALFGSAFLKREYGWESCCWVCRPPANDDPVPETPVTYLTTGVSKGSLHALAKKQGLDPKHTIVVSHGCWLAPSRVGYALSKLGYRWIHVPHGMLEPWSMKQGRLKKMLYYLLLERKFILSATTVRAVSRPEKANLEKQLGREVTLVENGVTLPAHLPPKDEQEILFLFMARLHYKKGVAPLVRAWKRVMDGAGEKTLIIAGPDEGELEKIRPLLTGNVRYIGAVYGKEKEDWLKRSHYYFLPSFSEGFPTSVLEAMSYGLTPLISEGCNFPEVFREDLGFRAEPDEEQLVKVLGHLKTKPFDTALSERNRDYIAKHYAEEVIGEELHKLYSSMQIG